MIGRSASIDSIHRVLRQPLARRRWLSRANPDAAAAIGTEPAADRDFAVRDTERVHGHYDRAAGSW